MNWFDFTLKLKGFPIEEAKVHLDKIQAIPEENYADYIEAKKQEILEFHLQHNSFYKNLVIDKKIEKWEDLPILTKKDLQQPLQDRLSEGYSTKNVYINKTSGSSGHPFVFAKDKFSHALTWSVIFNRFGWFGLDFNSSFQARFYGIPLDKFGYYKERLKDKMATRYRFPIFNLNDEKLKGFLAEFYKKKFNYINGYTSSIELFAKYLRKKNIILKDVCPTLKVCIVTSEMLFPETKKLLENQFGIPVVNEYGASELDLLAFQNPKDEWVLNNESLYIEVVNKNNQPLPYGSEGKIIVTSLYNKAHPFIRYELGDLGVISEKSTAKHQFLQKLTGRTNDVAKLPSGKIVPGLTFYYVTKSIIEDGSEVKEFVIKQKEKDTFEITYVSSEEISAEKENEIKASIEKYLEKGLTLQLNRVDVLKRKKSGKLKQFESLI
ncbi:MULTISPECIES: phenylacetate--CoA ligase family protein [Mesonia]|uniref:Phenylacetate-coenzyme A ligase n=1 Tax=Mesonia oceanica TaxID=2687242 RepID=A0AC61Y300_9FLAO|nr:MULTISPECIES: phenylacetate--CoA ligase family protein [Mesonia]MAN28509.1 AMP-binding protein [Mesonia sp.]MAQ41190.1 AMP-binding protein [Mesonia sp.]MBJ97288.1 AMP-binding protein [Flavobacteriaceae bacterium]VVU98763.1 Phenylacetate-coenzyme A ligase [Mesonia oceanica]